ncbi:hypothetical protein DFA_11861 [Cavenderia fasciculata]|uniref:Uncharacterized protein n=1 Tax=Cavenderia fasciculata TaxID=261658 RepID=F4QEI6_CACFS|nr:uncharacterized protein DFA_11861 [Cavenderia fasciculata]EGG14097.1 hypothetical protein DFA_11861 [Cavenderia fasciculata]|eukprot:XP_004350805.1 hypothetical protein DFA_11861 [Cavenderia fasciculata]
MIDEVPSTGWFVWNTDGCSSTLASWATDLGHSITGHFWNGGVTGDSVRVFWSLETGIGIHDCFILPTVLACTIVLDVDNRRLGWGQINM